MKDGSKILLGVALLMGVALTPAAYASSGQDSVGCSDGTITWSPTTLWPPNHKLVPITISYAVGDDDGDISIHIDSIEESEEPPGNGCGPSQTSDWTGVGLSVSGSDDDSPITLTGVKLRAERCGTGDGRTYTIHMSCCDDIEYFYGYPVGCEESDTADLTVTVPHNP